jgi:hypothetical protein
MSYSTKKARAIAFYLPQFHPIPENDEWWEKGFTEWTNVTKATPLFKGHLQPDLPSELGFYDLRVAETREAQAALARDYGVEGFAYWHYWFGNGKRILDGVFEDVLRSGKPDYPFCLAWANMTWSGIWHGLEGKILIEQKYPGMKDHEDHFNFLIQAFRDPRYIRVNGKPLFIIYRPEELPDSQEVLALWRRLAVASGLPGLYFLGIFSKAEHPGCALYDATTTSEPGRFKALATAKANVDTPRSFGGRVAGKLQRVLKGLVSKAPGGPTLASYESCVQNYLADGSDGMFTVPCVLPNWDNTPRSGNRGMVLTGSNPGHFQRVLKKAVASIQGRPWEERLLLIKSWNEWAEGNYLEPSRRFGHGYLEVVKKEIVPQGPLQSLNGPG